MTEQVSRGPTPRRARWWLVAALGAFVAGSPPALSQVLVRVNNDTYFRLGVLLQAWFDWQQDAATGGFSQNLFLRRARLMIGGQVAPDVSFFLVTDNPNLGRAPKNLASGFVLADANLEWKLRDEFRLVGGLMLMPLCRNCQQGVGTLLTLDYGTYTFLWTTPTQSPLGRDLGLMAKGYLVDQRLEYRIGAYQGAREPGSRNALRSTGRIQYNFFDTEVVVFYPGTYLGTKKILAAGAGYDLQQGYRALAADLFFDCPVGKAGGLSAQADFIHYDGGQTFTTLPAQNDWLVEAGFYVARVRLLPFLKFESQDFVDEANKANGQRRYQAGLTWYARGHNFNIRYAWTRVAPRTGSSTDQFTLQLQTFYF